MWDRDDQNDFIPRSRNGDETWATCQPESRNCKLSGFVRLKIFEANQTISSCEVVMRRDSGESCYFHSLRTDSAMMRITWRSYRSNKSLFIFASALSLLIIPV